MDKNELNEIYASIGEFNKAYKEWERMLKKIGRDMSDEYIQVRATKAKKFIDSMKRLADELQKVM